MSLFPTLCFLLILSSATTVSHGSKLLGGTRLKHLDFSRTTRLTRTSRSSTNRNKYL